MRQRITLGLAILIAVLAVVFALQNGVPMRVQLGPFLVESPTALILIVTFLLGVTTGVLALVPGKLKRRKQVRTLRRQLAHAEPGDTAPETIEENREPVPEPPGKADAEAPPAPPAERIP